MADIFLKQKVRHLIELETEIQKELSAITIRYNRLLNGYLEGLINPKTYEVSHKEISEKKMILEARRNEVKYTKADEFTKKIREMFELAQNLSETYKQGDHGRKLHILQKLEFELFVNNKKELTIEESKLLKALEILNYTLGNATENGTPVYGMKTRCLNHWTMASNKTIQGTIMGKKSVFSKL